MRVALLANWGLGAAILHHLAASALAEPVLVVTRLEYPRPDPHALAVARAAGELGLAPLSDGLPMDELARELIERGCELLLAHAFMRKLPRRVWGGPPLGGLNVHASLLPKHRGPSPVEWALRNGDRQCGLTCHRLAERLDGGDIVSQVSFPLAPGDDKGSVIEKQKLVVGELLDLALNRLADPAFRARPQDESRATYAPRLQSKGE